MSVNRNFSGSKRNELSSQKMIELQKRVKILENENKKMKQRLNILESEFIKMKESQNINKINVSSNNSESDTITNNSDNSQIRTKKRKKDFGGALRKNKNHCLSELDENIDSEIDDDIFDINHNQNISMSFEDDDDDDHDLMNIGNNPIDNVFDS